MEHSCSCCRESRTTVREVELKCPTGHSISHKYMYVESCRCQNTECRSSHSSESQSTEESDESSSTHHRSKRAISLTSKWRGKTWQRSTKRIMHHSHLPWLLWNFAFPSYCSLFVLWLFVTALYLFVHKIRIQICILPSAQPFGSF